MAANRFKKSIESVISNDDINASQGVLDNIIDNELINMTNNTCDNKMYNTLDTSFSNTSEHTEINILSNILSNIQRDEQRGKNITFYLSTEVEEAVSQIAKQNNISKSKLVDNILKQVLLKGKSVKKI